MTPEDPWGKALVSLVVAAGALVAWVCEVWYHAGRDD